MLITFAKWNPKKMPRQKITNLSTFKLGYIFTDETTTRHKIINISLRTSGNATSARHPTFSKSIMVSEVSYTNVI